MGSRGGKDQYMGSRGGKDQYMGSRGGKDQYMGSRGGNDQYMGSRGGKVIHVLTVLEIRLLLFLLLVLYCDCLKQSLLACTQSQNAACCVWLQRKQVSLRPRRWQRGVQGRGRHS